MKYKVLIILLVLGCSTDLAPDDKFMLKFDISYDEFNVVLRNIIEDLHFLLNEVVQFCLRLYLSPVLDLISFIAYNLNVYFQKNLYIWILFFKFDTIFKHTVYGVRCYNTFRRVFFVRSAGSAACVLAMLLTACVFNTSCLVTCVKVLQLPSLWTVLCSPWQLFVVKIPPTNSTTFVFGIVSSVDVYLEFVYTVCTNQNIIYTVYVFGSAVSGKYGTRQNLVLREHTRFKVKFSNLEVAIIDIHK